MEPVSEDSEVDIEIEVDETAVHMVGGKLSLEDFEILGVLGRGAYGKVFQVRKITSGVIYAMKVLRKKDVIKQKVVTHANAEKMVLTEVNHPFIVGLAFAFQTPAKLYLVMEYVGGGELFSRLDEVEEMEESEARFYACEVLLALEHLHNKDFVYRDLKPENILIRMNGHICLADFGFAKKTLSSDASTKTFCGTVHYMAPEIIQKTGHGKTVDWWSLGILIFEMLTGETPFHDANRKVIQQRVLEEDPVFPSHISDLARDLITSLLNKNTATRLGYRGAEEVKAHPWFKGADWNAYLTRKVKPPFVPAAINVLDTSNFDSKFTQEAAVDSPPTPALEVPASTLFKGFSYTAPSPLLLELPGRGRAFTPMSSPHLGPSALSGLASPATRAMMSPGYRSMRSPGLRGMPMASPGHPPKTAGRAQVGSPTAFLLPSGLKFANGHSEATHAHGNGSPVEGRVVLHPADTSQHTGMIQNLHAEKKTHSPEPQPPPRQATEEIAKPSDSHAAPTSPTASAILSSDFTADLKEDYFELRLEKQKKKRRPKKPQKPDVLSSQLSRLHFQTSNPNHTGVTSPPLLGNPPIYAHQPAYSGHGYAAHGHCHSGYTGSNYHASAQTTNHAFFSTQQQQFISSPPSAYPQGQVQTSSNIPSNQFSFAQPNSVTSPPNQPTARVGNYSALLHHHHQNAPLLYPTNQPAFYPGHPSHATHSHPHEHPATHLLSHHGTTRHVPQGSHSSATSSSHPAQQGFSHQVSHQASSQALHPSHQALLPLPATHQHPTPFPAHPPAHAHQHHAHQPSQGHTPQEPTRQYGFRVLSAHGSSTQPGVGPSKTLSHILRPPGRQSPLLSQVDQDVSLWTEYLSPNSSNPPRSILSTLTSFPKH